MTPRPLPALLLVACLAAAASPAAAQRRDDPGPRRPRDGAILRVAPRPPAPRAQGPALRINGVVDVPAEDVARAIAEGERSWQWLRELHSAETLLAEGETKEEFLVMNELAIPRIVRHLFAAQDEDNRRRAQEAYDRAKAGESWERIVSEYSTEPGAGPRGNIGVVAFDNLVAPYHRVMFEAPLGEVQPPVQTMFGRHVGRVMEILPPRDVTLADGSVVRRPETRRIEHVLVVWDVGEHDGDRRSDLRVELLDITRNVKVEVLDPAWCDELPHWCAGGSQGDASAPADGPAPDRGGDASARDERPAPRRGRLPR